MASTSKSHSRQRSILKEGNSKPERLELDKIGGFAKSSWER